MKSLTTLLGMVNFDTYDAQAKQKFHNQARKVLREIAKKIGVEKSEFNVSSNKAGPASVGEVTFHSDKLYIQIGGLNPENVLYRSCNGRKDSTGGTNQWTDMSELFSDHFIGRARDIQFA